MSAIQHYDSNLAGRWKQAEAQLLVFSQNWSWSSLNVNLRGQRFDTVQTVNMYIQYVYVEPDAL